MKHFSTVLTFHLKEGIRAKSFIITAVILFTLILSFFAFFHFYDDEKELEVGFYSQSETYPAKEEYFKEYDFLTFEAVEETEMEDFKKMVKDGDKDAFILVTETNGIPKVEYFFKRFPDSELSMVVQQVFQQLYMANVIEEHKIDAETQQALFQTIPLEAKTLEEDTSAGLVYFFGYLIFFFIIFYGQNVAMSIISEKTTRVMEVMITKVKPIVMMYAKVISSLLLGLFQIGVVLLSYLTAKQLGWVNSDGLNIFGIPLDLSLLSLEVFIYLIVYFILGYMLFTMLFASISSVVSRAEEVGAILFPVTALLLAGFFLSIRSMINPTDTLVVIGSYVPFFSPFVTFSRILAGEALFVEVTLSITLLIGTIILISYFANRLYVNGVMNYNNKASFKKLFTMMKKN